MQQAITLLGVFQMLLPFLPLQNGVHFDVSRFCFLWRKCRFGNFAKGQKFCKKFKNLQQVIAA